MKILLPTAPAGRAGRSCRWWRGKREGSSALLLQLLRRSWSFITAQRDSKEITFLSFWRIILLGDAGGRAGGSHGGAELGGFSAEDLVLWDSPGWCCFMGFYRGILAWFGLCALIIFILFIFVFIFIFKRSNATPCHGQ